MPSAAAVLVPASPLTASPTTLADGLRDERTLRAWSQQHLADAAGVSLRTVQRAERGDPVAGETLLALAAALDIDVQALVVARQRAVAAGSAPPADPDAAHFRRWPLDPERLAWAGFALAFPLLWFAAGAAVYMLTGSDAALPPLVQADGREFRMTSEAVGAAVVLAAHAGLLVNAGVLALRRDSGLSARLLAAAVAMIALVHLIALAA